MYLRNKNILVIDDTAAIRTFLRISLQARSSMVHEAKTAGEGVDLCAQVKPDLVVMDLGLPDRDGLDILPEIKSMTVNGKSPLIVILSVRKERTTKEKAFELGADDYITKPFLMDDFIEVIEGLMIKREQEV